MSNEEAPPAPPATENVVEKLCEDVKEWKREDLFMRSISESPEMSSREKLGGSSVNLATSSSTSCSSKAKFGSTFSIIKHKKVELTTYSDDRLDVDDDSSKERRKSGTDYVLEENVMKKAASIQLEQSSPKVNTKSSTPVPQGKN